MGACMTSSLHPAAPHHLPAFIIAPGETDVLMVGTGIFLIVAVLLAGNFFLWLHTLPERMAHKSKKMQFEIVAVLGLLALFTHVHLFWVAALLLAFIDLPEFGKPLDRMAGSLETIAGVAANERRSRGGRADARGRAGGWSAEGSDCSQRADRCRGEHTEQADACTRERKELTDA